MPRRPRRSRLSGGLTQDQQWLFAYGWDLLPAGAEPYPDHAAAREAWMMHRAELLATRRRGNRLSWGYKVFELDLRGFGGKPFVPEILDVETTEAKAAKMESYWSILRSAHGPDTGEPCGSESFLRSQMLTQDELLQIAAHFALAARWHERRGRPAESAILRRRGAVALRVAGGVP